MTEVISRKFNAISRAGSLNSVISGARLVTLLAVLAALITSAVVLGLWQGNSQYRPLYGEHEQYDRSQVISVLEQKGLDYYVEPQQGGIMVDRSVLGQARLAMAAAGVEAQLPAGLDVLSQDSSLGTSQFIENARYRHGLEGELARTIMSLDAVSNARVHLAIPKQTLFVGREKSSATASVVVALLPGQSLNGEQVSSIVSLVAGSVPELTAEHVNVVDQRGNLLSSLLSDSDQYGKGSTAYLEYLGKLERSYIDRAARMLRPMIGADNFQVQVAADINFDRVEATEELYGDEGKVRSEFESFDRRVGEPAQGIPGALANRPPDDEEDQNDKIRTERGENSRDFLMDKTLKHTRYQQGQIEQLSVSVLINGDPDTFSAAQRDGIQQMLTDAMGIKAARGDSLSVHVYPFNQAQAPMVEETPIWWMQSIWLDYLRYLLSAIVALVILLFIVRPAVRQLSGESKQKARAEQEKADALLTAENAQDSQALTDKTAVSKEGSTEQGVTAALAEKADDPLPELPSPETGLEVQTAYLQQLSEKEPERVAHVVRQWISIKDDADN